MIFRYLAALIVAVLLWSGTTPAWAQAVLYPPPLSYTGADLRGEDFSGQNLQSAEFVNANLPQTNFNGANLRGAIFSGVAMPQANLHGADLTYAMIDQANLTGADLSDAVFTESILLRTILDETDITNADFSDALLDGVQIRELCQRASGVNSQTGIATRESLGCR
ncbi:MAG: pentapeptide repeat-containing protein [Desertifilum sp. SIO1I2]|nr:pentapeptide repeat-containing protein [Desertifilum sp. SIO1I2]